MWSRVHLIIWYVVYICWYAYCCAGTWTQNKTNSPIIQPKTIDLSTRLVGITTEFVGFIPTSLVLRSIVLGWILIYRNWPIVTSSTISLQSIFAWRHGMAAMLLSQINPARVELFFLWKSFFCSWPIKLHGYSQREWKRSIMEQYDEHIITRKRCLLDVHA